MKVEFPDKATGVGEWLWVKVTRCDPAQQIVFGTLDNEPLNVQKTCSRPRLQVADSEWLD